MTDYDDLGFADVVPWASPNSWWKKHWWGHGGFYRDFIGIYRDLMGFNRDLIWFNGICLWDLPGLVMTNVAIEHGHRKFVDFPMKHGGSFHSYVNVYQRVPNINIRPIQCWKMNGNEVKPMVKPKNLQWTFHGNLSRLS